MKLYNYFYICLQRAHVLPLLINPLHSICAEKLRRIIYSNESERIQITWKWFNFEFSGTASKQTRVNRLFEFWMRLGLGWSGGINQISPHEPSICGGLNWHKLNWESHRELGAAVVAADTINQLTANAVFAIDESVLQQSIAMAMLSPQVLHTHTHTHIFHVDSSEGSTIFICQTPNVTRSGGVFATLYYRFSSLAFIERKKLKCHNFTVQQIYRDSNLIVYIGYLWWPLIEFGRNGSYANHLAWPADITLFFALRFCLFANNLRQRAAWVCVGKNGNVNETFENRWWPNFSVSIRCIGRGTSVLFLFFHLTQSRAQMHRRFEEARGSNVSLSACIGWIRYSSVGLP